MGWCVGVNGIGLAVYAAGCALTFIKLASLGRFALPQLSDGTRNHSGYSPLNVPLPAPTPSGAGLCRFGAQVRKRRWPGELSVRLAVYGPPLRIALVVGDVFALTAFERCLASWNVLLCIASGAGNRLHPLRYSRRYEYGRQNT